jgi:hypothetical protein
MQLVFRFLVGELMVSLFAVLAWVLDLRSGCCRQNDITEGFRKPNWIGHAINHEGGEHVNGITGYISALLNRRTDIQAVCPQASKKAVSVRFGRGNDSRVPSLESSLNELRHVFQKPSIIRTKPSFVATTNLYLLLRNQTGAYKVLTLKDRFHSRQQIARGI